MAIITKDTKEGQEYGGRPKKISWERLWTFSGGPLANSGWPRKNVHTDLEFAKECGLPSVAASATQNQGYVVQLMIDLFGVAWFSHGTMDVRFVGLTNVEDIVVPKAVVKSKEAHDNQTKYLMEVWVANQRGEKVLVGTATGIATQ